jgi:tRNA A37 N6-isopentenylltransferase MiaA
VQQSSRRYAKRQLTWFRRNKNMRWLIRDREEILSAARRYLQENDN